MSGLRRRGRNAQGFARASARPGTGSVLRVQGVEGWRALACLLVVFYHVWQNMDVNDNGVGPWADRPAVLGAFLNVDMVVDLFFVLSGLLLFLPFANAALDDTKQVPDRRNFLYRRVLRLYPLYIVVVLACWFPRNYGAGTAQWRDLLEHVFLVQAFDSERIFYTVGPAWTLSVEWIFYLTLFALGPVLVRWVREVATRPERVKRLAGALGVVVVASMLYKANVELVWDIPVTQWAWRFGPAAKADDLAIGMGLAVAMVLMRGRTLPVWVFPVLIAVTVGLVDVLRLPGDAVAPEWLLVVRHTGVALAWAIMLFAFMTCRSSVPARAIDNPVLVKVGILTFAIYLIHEPMLLAIESAGLFSMDPDRFWVNVVVVFAITLVAALFAHRMIEEPWTDAAALQRRGGGRTELYPHLLAPTVAPRPVASAPAGQLRQQMMASISGAPQ